MYLKPLIEIAVINALWLLMTSEKYDIEDPKKREVMHIMSEYGKIYKTIAPQLIVIAIPKSTLFILQWNL